MQLAQEQLEGHLSPDAAQAFLNALPEYVREKLEARAEGMQFPTWAVLEMAIAGYLVADATSFNDFDSRLKKI